MSRQSGLSQGQSAPKFSLELQGKAQLPTSICLNMIVKNESHVIRRCLASVRSLITYWVIVDTGSTDGTQAVIQDFMKDIPGELHKGKWVDFAHNRNEALQLAKGKADYTLFIDADQILQFDAEFEMPKLDKDYYSIREVDADTSSLKIGLVKSCLDWKWEWVIHEALKVPKKRTSAILKGVILKSPHDGFRSQDPEKLKKDAETLEAALRNDPHNTRYQFYLALTYAQTKQYELALKCFEKRIEMRSWKEEVFWSMLNIGIIYEILHKPEEMVVSSYFNAYKYDPSRAEPLYHLAAYFYRTHNYEGGYLFASQGLLIPAPQDTIFIKQWIYDYGLRIELINCAFKLGKYEEAQQACVEVLANPNLPEHVREELTQNQVLIQLKLLNVNTERDRAF